MRKLIVLCDGTWKTADDDTISNVVKTMDAIPPMDEEGASQILFYVKGVGSGNSLDRIFGGAFGEGLARNVRDGYRQLVQNYAEGDEIYFFGFSRGAYTARSIAGMIRCCGLVRKEHAGKISEAYEIYRQRDAMGADKPEAVEFREKYSREIRVKFVGVWDTVGALGVPLGRMLRMLSRRKHGFHDTALSRSIDNAFHALAIDEKRYTFEPSLWTVKPREGQRVEQVWFVGAHSDVGGGYKETDLSDCALQWMLERARECGLSIHPDALARAGKATGTLHCESWVRRFGLPGNIRDVARNAAYGETVHATVAERHGASLQYAPENYVDTLQSPRGESPLRRPFLVRALRSLLGSNAIEEGK
ncbi:MAG TPA: DUF2235 domain-containing protein [Thermoanaerobaculia bacterium]|nr:DUF2235 domain-containing protein [Thermoanaerobaculia bacterium]